MLRLLTFLTALTLATAAFADDAGVPDVETNNDWSPDRVYLTFGSKHLNIDPTNFGLASWNETNPGVIFTWEDRGRLGLNYSLGAFQNSFADRSLFASTGKTWAVGDTDLRLGFVVGLADYGQNARLIATQLGTSDWIVTGGAQIEYRNLFFQLQPAGRQLGGGYGAVLVAGVSFALGE